MRILFICGSIDPGKNGVGDYTRKLAYGFSDRGVATGILAINEKECEGVVSLTIPTNNQQPISALRLSSKRSWKIRRTDAKSFVKDFQPDIVSLQFVPFSFQDKGLPFFLLRWLKGLSQHPLRWHVMFHELWVADSKAHSARKYVMRELQKMIIKSLLKKLDCQLVHTSNSYYQGMLQRIGFGTQIVPIFSNLPKSGNKRVIDLINNRSSKLIAIFFGHLQPNNAISKKIFRLAKMVENQLSKKLEIVHIGNNRNPQTQALLQKISDETAIVIHFVGFLDADSAADVIAGADVGLSSYYPDLIQKSGSISSLLYNGLPVILLSGNPTKPIEGISEVSALENINDISRFIHQDKEFISKYSPDNTIDIFLEAFTIATNARVKTSVNWQA